jgi:heterodisulfide reductase subunit A
VVGGGVAGMRAALYLADAGHKVVLAEKDSFLGGQVMRLDKVYPTDHCAFCPVWPLAAACRSHPGITTRLSTQVLALKKKEASTVAVLRTTCSPVSAVDCVFCGLCLDVCPRKAISGRRDDIPYDPASPPLVVIRSEACDGCGECAARCPTRAIDLSVLKDGKTVEERLRVQGVIFATGFEEPVPGPAPEFGAHSHPDILTAMAFEKTVAEFRAEGALRCPSDKRLAKSIAFVQCAGARDRRYLAYCSAVCCMHAAKQARWLKRRDPALDVAVFYTDLRAPGKGQERYMRAAASEGVRLIRRRPGLVSPLDQRQRKGILIRHEEKDKVLSTVVDIVVLNGGLACSPGLERESAQAPLSSSCGFCREPADIARSVIQAGDAVNAFLAGPSRPEKEEATEAPHA